MKFTNSSVLVTRQRSIKFHGSLGITINLQLAHGKIFKICILPPQIQSLPHCLRIPRLYRRNDWLSIFLTNTEVSHGNKNSDWISADPHRCGGGSAEINLCSPRLQECFCFPLREFIPSPLITSNDLPLTPIAFIDPK